MKITRTSSILGIVGPRSRSRHDFKIFLHLLQYKFSGPITQLWYNSPGSYQELPQFFPGFGVNSSKIIYENAKNRQFEENCSNFRELSVALLKLNEGD